MENSINGLIPPSPHLFGQNYKYELFFIFYNINKGRVQKKSKNMMDFSIIAAFQIPEIKTKS